MKKTILASILSIFTLLALVGCGNKQSFMSLVTGNNTNSILVKNNLNNSDEVSNTDNQETDEKEKIVDNDNNQLDTKNDIDSEINANDYEIFEDINYFEFDYTSEDGVFTITAIKNKIDKDNDIVTPITQARGYISGISGTYFIELPYTKQWKNGDKVDIIYKKAYDYDKDETIIADILYVDPSTKQKELPTFEDVFEENIATNSEIISTQSEILEIE